jgi:hypothetical protein
MRIAIAALALAAQLLSAPAFAAADKPLVIESGKIKQLPGSTTLQVNASGTGAASINIPHGTAPTSPTNGDCWTTTSGLFCYINGATVGPYGGGGSSIAAKDEGTTLTSAATSFDFVGAGVTATNSSGAVTVTVPAGAGAVAARVDTPQSATSLTYTDLTTTGPAVTLTTGTSAIVFLSANVTKPLGGLGNNGYISVAVSGATTLAASDTNGTTVSYPTSGGGFAFPLMAVVYLTGLTAGSNTFTMKYRINGGNAWQFGTRTISVVPQ